MSRHQRRFDDVEFDLGGRSRSGGVGSVVLATVLGVGIGMLAAPDTGLKTRRRLRRRLSELGEGLEGGIDEIQERGGRAREVVRDRLARAKQRGAEAWEDIEGRFAEDEGGRRLRRAEHRARDRRRRGGHLLPDQRPRRAGPESGSPDRRYCPARGHRPVGALPVASPRGRQRPHGDGRRVERAPLDHHPHGGRPAGRVTLAGPRSAERPPHRGPFARTGPDAARASWRWSRARDGRAGIAAAAAGPAARCGGPWSGSGRSAASPCPRHSRYSAAARAGCRRSA